MSLWLPNIGMKSKAFPNRHRSDTKYYTGLVCLNYFVGSSLLLIVLPHLTKASSFCSKEVLSDAFLFLILQELVSCFCAKHGLYFSLSYLWRDLVSWDKYYSVKQAGNYQAPGKKKKRL